MLITQQCPMKCFVRPHSTASYSSERMDFHVIFFLIFLLFSFFLFVLLPFFFFPRNKISLQPNSDQYTSYKFTIIIISSGLDFLKQKKLPRICSKCVENVVTFFFLFSCNFKIISKIEEQMSK